MNNFHNQINIKSVACGVMLSIMVNAVYVLSLYFSLPFQLLYLIPIITALLIRITIREENFKKIALSVSIIIISNILAEFILDATKLTNYFYYMRYPTANEIAIGDSIIMVFIYIMEFIGILVGTTLVCISAFRKRK